MARRHWALVLMGAWMMGTICVSIVAAENFYTIDRLLAARDSSGFASFVDRLGVAPARELLRYLSSELNRLYFQLWNLSQIVLGAVVWGLVRRLDRTASRGVLAMLVVVVLLLAWLTPAIVTLGRSRFRAARSAAVRNAAILDPSRGLHVARVAEARGRILRDVAAHPNPRLSATSASSSDFQLST